MDGFIKKIRAKFVDVIAKQTLSSKERNEPNWIRTESNIFKSYCNTTKKHHSMNNIITRLF